MRFVFLFALLASNAIVWAIPIPHGLSVSFLDVGQGDAIFIETADGVQILIDGGPDASVLRGIGSRMFFWDRSLDAIVATHPDKDHIGGLTDVLRRYDVGSIVESGIIHDTSFARSFETLSNSEDAERFIGKRGMRLLLGEHTYAEVLYPVTPLERMKDTNAGSIILRVVYGETSFLLTGDAPAKAERAIVSAYGEKLKSDVLKVGHHGSKTSSDPLFLDTVQPQYAVYSRGCDNSYGHPAPEIKARYEAREIKTFDTCESGTVTFLSDGVQLLHQP
jgi:competence protein ComEC